MRKAKIKKVPPCIRALSRAEVAEVWLSLKEQADREERLVNANTTPDGQGVWLGRDDFDRAFYQKIALERARHILLDRCDRKRTR